MPVKSRNMPLNVKVKLLNIMSKNKNEPHRYVAIQGKVVKINLSDLNL